MNDFDLKMLRRCVDLAEEALNTGDEPFGSLLANSKGEVLFEDRNRVAGGDRTQHPEFAIARWSANNMTPEERERSTVYTSGEHCPMCAAAHAWAGLGRIVYASSSEQLVAWLCDLGLGASPVRALSVNEVAPNVIVEGPVPELAEKVRQLHFRFHGRS